MNIPSTLLWIVARTAFFMAFAGVLAFGYSGIFASFTNRIAYDLLVDIPSSFWLASLAAGVMTQTFYEVRSRMTLADRDEFALTAKRIAKRLAPACVCLAFGILLYDMFIKEDMGLALGFAIVWVSAVAITVVFSTTIVMYMRKRKARAVWTPSKDLR